MTRAVESIIRLEVSTDLGKSTDGLLPEHHAVAARLLRDAADRIEKGADLGGFHFSTADSFDGGFALIPVKK